MYSNLKNQATCPELWKDIKTKIKSSLIHNNKVLDLAQVKVSELVCVLQ
jgi:hypothetical protein